MPKEKINFVVTFLFPGFRSLHLIRGDASLKQNLAAEKANVALETFQACDGGTIITREQGLVLSPNFPRFYGPNMNCNWTLVAPERNVK